VAISGRLLADVRRFPSGCSGLLEVDRVEARGVEGRTELQLPECPAVLLWSIGDAGGASALAAGPKPSGLVGTAAAAAIRTPAADHRNLAGV